MQRVLVLGCSGSGKSTFTARLAGLIGIPTVSLDALHWQPGWCVPERDVFNKRVEAAAQEQAWIMDGNYLSWGAADLRAARADTVFWFDLPRWLCIARVVKRIVVGYGRVRPEMAPGCPEQIDIEFLRYVWTYRRKQRPAVANFVADLRPAVKVFHFTGRVDADKFLTDHAAPLALAGV